MFGKIAGLFRNRDFILFLGLLLGLFFDSASQWTRPLVLPALGCVMTLSTIGISTDTFRKPGSLVLPSFLGVLMSYGVLSSVILAMAAVLVHDEALWSGFVILAAVPPAVAVIPFADFLKGDRVYALIGTSGGYLAGLFLMPFTALVFLEMTIAKPFTILIIILELIIAPLVVSRVLMRTSMDSRLAPYKGTVTNWCFFVVVYTVVGLNQEHFVRNPIGLIPVFLIAACSTFALGFVIERIAILLKVKADITTSLVLLGTLKNYGLAAGVSLALFGSETALPATVSTIFMIIYIIWLGYKRLK